MRGGRRGLGRNEERYKAEEVELDADGEPVVEPEVDLSSFLEKQRISDDIAVIVLLGAKREEVDAEDIDTSLAHVSSHTSRLPPQAASKKGKIEQMYGMRSLRSGVRQGAYIAHHRHIGDSTETRNIASWRSFSRYSNLLAYSLDRKAPQGLRNYMSSRSQRM
ncbi:hypothetical protein B0H34DRAFT_719331 [Crassisporium funariophilum]|nr:hypothetical protein B0H34DRAFT_719331 [Crassisporium funariophilum]